jgi:hypothetical protein
MTTYLFRRVGGGRCAFAKVTVTKAKPGCPDGIRLGPSPTPNSVDSELLAEVLRGAATALTECFSPGIRLPALEVAEVVFTVLDSTREAAYIAGFMATAKLLGREPEYRPIFEGGRWMILCVGSSRRLESSPPTQNSPGTAHQK